MIRRTSALRLGATVAAWAVVGAGLAAPVAAQTTTAAPTSSAQVALAVFRPSDRTFYFRGRDPLTEPLTDAIPVPADYYLDGLIVSVVYQPSTSTWWTENGCSDPLGDCDGVYNPYTFRFGRPGDIPVPADYPDPVYNAKTALPAVFRPSNGTWYIASRFAGGKNTTVPYGRSGDVPVPADYLGTGSVELAVFRPSEGAWHIRGTGTVPYGRSGDVPVPADYLGTGRAQVAVFRPSDGTWYVRGGSPVPFGRRGDVPVPGDYLGDGRTELAVFRPSNGTWYIRGVGAIPYGRAGDVPVPGDQG